MGSGGWVQRLNSLWVVFYTSGLTESQKRARRDEIESDMFDHGAFGAGSETGAGAIKREVASRLVRGLAADAMWRWEAGQDSETVVKLGGTPPMPWISSIFLGCIVVLGAVSSTDLFQRSDAEVSLAMASVVCAAVVWLGLHLATHRFVGPLLIAIGAAGIAWSLWWTFVLPVAAVAVGIAGVRRAQRIERLLALD